MNQAESSHEHHEPPVRAGVFESPEHAQEAVALLKQNGFTNQEISVICSDESKLAGFSKFVAQSGGDVLDADDAMVAGGAAGLALGGVAALAIAGGPLGVLAAVGAIQGFALTGTFLGAMVNRGFEPQAVEFYQQALGQGQLLVTVEVRGGDDVRPRLALAERLLNEAGARAMSMEK